MSNFEQIPKILHEAYDHYEATGNKHFTIFPKSPDYLLSVINSINALQEENYIDNISDNLLNDEPVHLAPLETMSFDITFTGIEFVKRNRKD